MYQTEFENKMPSLQEDDKILLNEFIRHIKNKMADYELDSMIITKDIMLEILSDLEIPNHE